MTDEVAHCGKCWSAFPTRNQRTLQSATHRPWGTIANWFLVQFAISRAACYINVSSTFRFTQMWLKPIARVIRVSRIFPSCPNRKHPWLPVLRALVGEQRPRLFQVLSGFLWLYLGWSGAWGRQCPERGWLRGRPLRLSALPDRAELFWSTEEVTITERQPAKEPGQWVFSC